MKLRVAWPVAIAGTLGCLLAWIISPIGAPPLAMQHRPSIEEMGTVYGLPEQYKNATNDDLVAELLAYRTAFQERAVPLFQEQFSSGQCEVITPADGIGAIRVSHFMDLEATECVDGVFRRAVLDPASQPELLEYRVRVQWLYLECRARGCAIPE